MTTVDAHSETVASSTFIVAVPVRCYTPENENGGTRSIEFRKRATEFTVIFNDSFIPIGGPGSIFQVPILCDHQQRQTCRFQIDQVRSTPLRYETSWSKQEIISATTFCNEIIDIINSYNLIHINIMCDERAVAMVNPGSDILYKEPIVCDNPGGTRLWVRVLCPKEQCLNLMLDDLTVHVNIRGLWIWPQ